MLIPPTILSRRWPARRPRRAIEPGIGAIAEIRQRRLRLNLAQPTPCPSLRSALLTTSCLRPVAGRKGVAQYSETVHCVRGTSLAGAGEGNRTLLCSLGSCIGASWQNGTVAIPPNQAR